jgi:hypothetical protein
LYIPDTEETQTKMPQEKQVTAKNVNVPGYTQRLDATKFVPVRDVVLAVLADAPDGLTLDELNAAIRPHLPQDVFPGGEKVGWWMMAVKLDLEAKGEIERVPKSKPQRVRRV